MSQNQGHTIVEHEIQLRVFIKRIADDDAWLKACRMLDDVLAFPTKENVAEVWEFVDAQPKGRSRDEVAKKPHVGRKPRKARQPLKAVTKPAPMNPCPGQCGGKNRRFVFPDGKIARLCPSCHKAGKVAIVGSPRQVLTRRRVITPQDMRFLNAYEADEMRCGRRPNRDDHGGGRTKRAGSLNSR